MSAGAYPCFVDTPTPRRGAGGERKAPCWHDKRQLCRKKFPLAGIDAPTPAREKGLQPYGALTLFFRWRKKSVQKKASGTATPGKSPLLPIFERGSSQCRAQHSWTANIYVRARSCSLFSSFKKGKAFSLRCLSPLCSPAVGGGQAYPLRVGMVSCWLADFGRSSASGFGGREPRGLSPNGGLHSPSGREPHQTGEPRGLSPSGGSFTAKPHVPRAPCAPTARSPG